MTAGISRRSLLAGTGAALTGAALGVSVTAARAQNAPPRNQSGGLIRIIANENPYGPSPRALEALRQAGPESWKYSSRQEGELKSLIAEREGVRPRQIMISAGSGEILRCAAVAFGMGGGDVVVARPTFSFLPTYASSIGCTVREIGLDDEMRHDLGAMAGAVDAGTKLVYVCNPNNPTGTLIDGKTLRPFVSEVSARAPVLVDEAYLDIGDDLSEHTTVDNVRAGDQVIVTRTFSKLHGLAGLRIGYAIGPADLIKRLETYRMSILNLPGLRAATASYLDQEFQDFSREKIAECLSTTRQVFDELGKTCAPTRGNFIYFDTGGSPGKFMAGMRERGFLTGLSYKPYDSWSRVSMGTTEQMRAFADAARDYFL